LRSENPTRSSLRETQVDSPHVLHGAWAKARADVGLPDLHLHDVRHLAGTLAASTGAGTKLRSSRTASATPATKPPSATSTPPDNETEPSPTHWIACWTGPIPMPD
jgi:hypothetical protein